jgi:hypothetical protein
LSDRHFITAKGSSAATAEAKTSTNLLLAERAAGAPDKAVLHARQQDCRVALQWMAEDCSAMARSGPPYLPAATALHERMGALVNDIKALESSGETIFAALGAANVRC